MNQDLRTFYDLTQRTRSKVLDWLEALPPEVFTRQHDGFAYGSLSAIQAHVADCYLWWIGTVGLGGIEEPEIKVDDVQALRRAFARVDATVLAALDSFTELDAPFIWTSPAGEIKLSRRWLILQPITHEFHHKGQALALARVLGYPHPGKPDTDLIDS